MLKNGLKRRIRTHMVVLLAALVLAAVLPVHALAAGPVDDGHLFVAVKDGGGVMVSDEVAVRISRTPLWYDVGIDFRGFTAVYQVDAIYDGSNGFAVRYTLALPPNLHGSAGKFLLWLDRNVNRTAPPQSALFYVAFIFKRKMPSFCTKFQGGYMCSRGFIPS